MSQINHIDKSAIKRGRTRTVEVSGVGPALLRPLPSSAVIDFQRELSQVSDDSSGVNQISILLRAVSVALVDDDGNRLFDNDEAGDIPFDIFTELQPIVMEMLGVKSKTEEGDTNKDGANDDNPLDMTASADSPTDSLSE